MVEHTRTQQNANVPPALVIPQRSTSSTSTLNLCAATQSAEGKQHSAAANATKRATVIKNDTVSSESAAAAGSSSGSRVRTRHSSLPVPQNQPHPLGTIVNSQSAATSVTSQWPAGSSMLLRLTPHHGPALWHETERASRSQLGIEHAHHLGRVWSLRACTGHCPQVVSSGACAGRKPLALEHSERLERTLVPTTALQACPASLH
eukprot:CAMPEP_0181196238 /NCGR_PEP_ID=MMETSP1096-20121128/15346_1 /TAXON_ID=156174 ORGANISM="Chrysochromulina ericina, Strain CCMP281" /NCGR_SAMPLE_ID=MMETSP1096 /ASSEMBLY_ACC=CAM_ASM_000453 /LENGTH=204 /DNA_ID=CAMNT_0023285959 /DNA_START=194 /DNA_END=805 /DNA_ORIENTATION=+